MNARSVTSTLLSQAMRYEGFLMIHTEFLSNGPVPEYVEHQHLLCHQLQFTQ